jgi:hypothetical protein
VRPKITAGSGTDQHPATTSPCCLSDGKRRHPGCREPCERSGCGRAAWMHEKEALPLRTRSGLSAQPFPRRREVAPVRLEVTRYERSSSRSRRLAATGAAAGRPAGQSTAPASGTQTGKSSPETMRMSCWCPSPCSATPGFPRRGPAGLVPDRLLHGGGVLHHRPGTIHGDQRVDAGVPGLGAGERTGAERPARQPHAGVSASARKGVGGRAQKVDAADGGPVIRLRAGAGTRTGDHHQVAVRGERAGGPRDSPRPRHPRAARTRQGPDRQGGRERTRALRAGCRFPVRGPERTRAGPCVRGWRTLPPLLRLPGVPWMARCSKVSTVGLPSRTSSPSALPRRPPSAERGR